MSTARFLGISALSVFLFAAGAHAQTPPPSPQLQQLHDALNLRPDQDAAWSENSLAGVHRFLARLWRLGDTLSVPPGPAPDWARDANRPAPAPSSSPVLGATPRLNGPSAKSPRTTAAL